MTLQIKRTCSVSRKFDAGHLSTECAIAETYPDSVAEIQG